MERLVLDINRSMNSFCINLNTISLKPNFSHSFSSFRPMKPNLKLCSTLQCRPLRLRACFDSDIDMVRNKQGIYTPKHNNKVVVLWDLDNKPPRGPPYEAALALKQVAQKFGEIVDISAYANRHAFIHLPRWVLEERRERKHLDVLERKGVVTPSQPYVCGVCGRKCKTNLDLKKHFKQLHERERNKKLNRMKQLKGKKKQKFKERFISENHKYNETAQDLIKPKIGYGLANELRRAGVYVKTVEDKPQAADWALKRQMQHSMSRGIDWLVLVSDDGDYKDMLRKAKEANLGTVVVGDWDRALGREADLWVPWMDVENGQVREKDLVPKRTGAHGGFGNSEKDLVPRKSGVGFNGGFDLDAVLGEIIGGRGEFDGAVRVSAFSEEDEGVWGTHEVDEEEEDGYLFDDSDSDSDDDEYF